MIAIFEEFSTRRMSELRYPPREPVQFSIAKLALATLLVALAVWTFMLSPNMGWIPFILLKAVSASLLGGAIGLPLGYFRIGLVVGFVIPIALIAMLFFSMWKSGTHW